MQDRITTTLQSVGTDWVTVEVPNCPRKFYFLRVRAIPTGPATTVALRVMEENDETTTALEYSLTSNYIDYDESSSKIAFIGKQSDARKATSSVWISVKSNDGTEATTIKVMLDVES